MVTTSEFMLIVRKQMITVLQQEEYIIKEGAANYHKYIENIGGKLFVTNHRVFFEPHSFNVQCGITYIDINKIMGVRKCWTKLLGVICVFPNAVAVYLVDGKEHRFTVWGRNEWIHAINTIIQQRNNNSNQ